MNARLFHPGRIATALLFAALAASPAASLAGGRSAHADPAAAASLDGRQREALRRHPLRTLDGRTLTLADLEGEVVVVNFWASWCRPCRRELPGLDALNRELAQGAGGARGRVVAISIDADRENARRFVAEHRLALPVYHDGPDALARQLDLDRVPTTVVIDRGGRIAFVHAGGGAHALAELTAVTRRLLATRTAAAEHGTTTEDAP